jgi:DNA-binding MarR family transcriptional regulator
MSEKRTRAASLVVDVIPKFMRALASDWRHDEHSPDPGHFRVLLILMEGPANLSTLAAKLEVSLPTMSNSISTLVERGWVLRRRDPDDRRRVLIEITPRGCGVLEHIRNVAQTHVSHALRDLSEEECELIIEGMMTLGRAFDGNHLVRES